MVEGRKLSDTRAEETDVKVSAKVRLRLETSLKKNFTTISTLYKAQPGGKDLYVGADDVLMPLPTDDKDPGFNAFIRALSGDMLEGKTERAKKMMVVMGIAAATSPNPEDKLDYEVLSKHQAFRKATREAVRANTSDFLPGLLNGSSIWDAIKGLIEWVLSGFSGGFGGLKKMIGGVVVDKTKEDLAGRLSREGFSAAAVAMAVNEFGEAAQDMLAGRTTAPVTLESVRVDRPAAAASVSGSVNLAGKAPAVALPEVFTAIASQVINGNPTLKKQENGSMKEEIALARKVFSDVGTELAQRPDANLPDKAAFANVVMKETIIRLANNPTGNDSVAALFDRTKIAQAKAAPTWEAALKIVAKNADLAEMLKQLMLDPLHATLLASNTDIRMAAGLKVDPGEVAAAKAAGALPPPPSGPIKVTKGMIIAQLEAKLDDPNSKEVKQLKEALGRDITPKELDAIAGAASDRINELLDPATPAGKQFAGLTPAEKYSRLYNYMMLSGTNNNPGYDPKKPGVFSAAQAANRGDPIPYPLLSMTAATIADRVMTDVVVPPAGLAQYKREVSEGKHKAWMDGQEKALVYSAVSKQVRDALMPMLNGKYGDANIKMGNMLAMLSAREGKAINKELMCDQISAIVANYKLQSMKTGQPINEAALQVELAAALRGDERIGLPTQPIEGSPDIIQELSSRIARRSAQPGKPTGPAITDAEATALMEKFLDVADKLTDAKIKEDDKTRSFLTALSPESKVSVKNGVRDGLKAVITGEAFKVMAGKDGFFCQLIAPEQRKLLRDKVFHHTRFVHFHDQSWTNPKVKTRASTMAADTIKDMLVPATCEAAQDAAAVKHTPRVTFGGGAPGANPHFTHLLTTQPAAKTRDESTLGDLGTMPAPLPGVGGAPQPLSPAPGLPGQ